MAAHTDFFVTADWLQEHLGKPGLSIVDGSWYLPQQNRDARAEYDAGHIPGAVFFDQDLVVEPGVPLPHALPSPEEFARHAGTMGICVDDTIIVYDGPGLFSAPRVRWLFQVMGAGSVRILEGGIDGWKKEGRPVDVEPVRPPSCFFEADFDPARVVRFEEMQDIVASNTARIVDARPAGRFTGEEPEPRPGMRSGHMPGASNVPAMALSREGRILPIEELRALFDGAGVERDRPIVTTCGSGVTAATLALALEMLGRDDVRLYDGSWSEWGSRDDTPVETGPAMRER